MIREFLSKHGDYSSDKSFKQLTTIKMGGEIAHYIEPYGVDDLKEIIKFLKENLIDFKVLGNGSNLICGSDYYDGVVISLKHFDNYEIQNTSIYVEAGLLAPYLANKLANEGLSGLEFASGIPGTIGGLIYMNAGAYKKEMADIVKEVVVLKNNEVVTMSKDELKFFYRHSIFMDHPHWLIIAAYLEMEEKDTEEIKSLMKDRLDRRKETQPLDRPSAGSCFRNPNNDFAWKLIDSIGYRGYKKNGIEVSNKHSNFILNVDNGNGEDYLEVARDIQDKVMKKCGVKLIMEVEKFNC